MKVLITGAGGQLGRELQRTVPAEYELVAHDASDLDITDVTAIQKTISTFKPELIINTAAYTAVDRAEQEPDLAYAVNCDGAANIARIASENSIRLVHISTDYVFDGKQSSPYLPEDQANPLSVYGASKWAGEQRVMEIMDGNAVILRTAWLYSAFGHNFVTTMLKLMNERERLDVVTDQIGTPTWARGLAEVIWKAAENHVFTGIWHWTDAGVASWYDFAIAIQEEALKLGLLTHQIPIKPIATSDYLTVAERPAYSVLDKALTWQALGDTAHHWRVALRQMINEIQGGVTQEMTGPI